MKEIEGDYIQNPDGSWSKREDKEDEDRQQKSVEFDSIINWLRTIFRLLYR